MVVLQGGYAALLPPARFGCCPEGHPFLWGHDAQSYGRLDHTAPPSGDGATAVHFFTHARVGHVTRRWLAMTAQQLVELHLQLMHHSRRRVMAQLCIKLAQVPTTASQQLRLPRVELSTLVLCSRPDRHRGAWEFVVVLDTRARTSPVLSCWITCCRHASYAIRVHRGAKVSKPDPNHPNHPKQ